MMCLPSTTILLSCCFIVTILFLKSSSSLPTDWKGANLDQPMVIRWPSVNHRLVRTTKFPRIGRSLLDSDETTSIVFDTDASSSSEDKTDEDNSSDHDLHLMDERSVLFPRIGKRAFHNLLWANALSNPHRMLDAQGRYFLNGYDHHIHQPRPQFQSRYRGKRSLQM